MSAAAQAATSEWWVFPGFRVEVVASGLDLPVNIAFVPGARPGDDGPLLYITELYGNVKVVTGRYEVKTYAEGLLNYKPNHRFPGSGESGLIGIAVEPESGDLFLSHIYEQDGRMRNKIVRTKSGDGLARESMETIIEGIPSVHAAHQIQALTFGFDGKLYANVGDGMMEPEVAQDDEDLRGKILRLELDGGVPSDNPRPGSPVFAKGVRNPFGAAWRKSDGALYISDNGPERDDRLVRVSAGGNYGWPGHLRDRAFLVWQFTQGVTAIAFMEGDQFPAEFQDELFVAAFGMVGASGRSVKGKKILKLRLNDDASAVSTYDEFVTYAGDGTGSPCGLAFGPDGLYFTDLLGEKGGVSGIPDGRLYRIVPADGPEAS